MTRNTNSEHVKEIFSHYGDVKSVRLDVDERSKLRFPPGLFPIFLISAYSSLAAWEQLGWSILTVRPVKPPSTILMVAKSMAIPYL